MNLQTCGCNCNTVAPQPAKCDKCRSQLTVNNIGELVWLQGLDVNLCERFQKLADVVSLRDCAGNRISLDTPIVMCSDFKNQLCLALAGLANGGEAIPGSTKLIGNDCKVYTIPAGVAPAETPNAAIDTTSVNLTLSGTLNRTIKADVLVSPDAGNTLQLNPNGLFVPPVGAPISTCMAIQAFAVGPDAIEGTLLIGADCQKHTLRYPDPITVTDTSSVDLTLAGTNLSANLRLDPTSIGRVTGDGFQITCFDILVCAPAVTVVDTTSLDLSIVGQQVTGIVRISTDPSNALSVRPNGLFVDVCSALAGGNPPQPAVVDSTVLVGADCNRYTLPVPTPMAVVDTTSVDLTFDGTTLQADVNLQPATLLTMGAQGLQVTCEATQDCVFGISNNFWSYNDLGNSVAFLPSADAANQIGVGSDGRPYVPAMSLTATNSNCIQLAITAGVIQAQPIISAAANNGLQCLTDGLFAPANMPNIVGGDTACASTYVQLLLGTYTVFTQPTISPTVGNQLQCLVDGLFSRVNIVTTPNNCIQITVTESPVGTYTITADPIIDPDVNNALSCGPEGLFASGSGGASVSVLGQEEFCISTYVTEDPAGTFTVYAIPNINPLPGNQIQCTSGGLLVPELTAEETSSVDLDLIGNGLYANVKISSDPTNILTIDSEGLYVPPAIIAGELCSDTSPSLFGLVLGTDSGGNTEWQNPTRTDTTVVTTVLDTINDATDRQTVFWLTADVELPSIVDHCSRSDIYLKNTSGASVVVSSADLIDGQPFITLNGTITGGYPLGGNGGESVHLYFSYQDSTWRIL